MSQVNASAHRVLVVEDSATMRAVCIDKFNQRGLECDPADSGESAWALLANSLNDCTYSAILLDWILPGMSGETLLRRIKADKRFMNVAVMIFTEKPDDSAWELVLARPNTDIQLKDELDQMPQRMEKFISTVENKSVTKSIQAIDPETIKTRAQERILLVDDSDTVRMRYSSLLREAGYHVIEASGYHEGLAMALEESPSLAIIDFYMPDGNGDQLCRAINENVALDFSFVMFSSRKEMTEVALEVGALDLLFKDDPAHLFLMRINAIMQVIRSRRVHQQLDLLVWSTQAFGFGILRKTPSGLIAENPTMLALEEEVGDLTIFVNEASYEHPLKIMDKAGIPRFFVVQKHEYSEHEEVIVTQDITLMKKAERDIQIAKELAENANQAKSDFLSTMTHELRSPLNSIIVLSRVLSKKNTEGMSSRQIESAEIIHRSGNDLLTLIDDILDLAKVEAGKISVEARQFDFRLNLRRLMSQLSPLTDTKGLSLTSNVDDNVPDLVKTDEVRLNQIIRNLVSNAVKFTQQGGVTIAVSMQPLEMIRLSVTDTGMGIKPENLKLIFEAFQQEDTSTSRRFGGTGLGLNISRNMIRLLGGEIYVTSTLGEGSCFTIDFQSELITDGPDTPNLEKPPSVGSDTEETLTTTENQNTIVKPTSNTVDNNPNLHKKTLLLVEDDTRNVFTMMAALEKFDFNFVIAGHGQEALNHLQNDEKTPDIILMDIMMPVMDGFEAIEKIRANDLWRNIPIIAVTANDKNNEEDKCKKLGANDFLAKPVDIDVLIEKMTSALSVH
ncbi:hypothetical protein A9Q99_00160 [Gammaproteobacteria bacterium 45_16_T64]|nr:hypothetical protein A9Q99_00160 [Gammaproteobacteria bacterium 45_16_T64]